MILYLLIIVISILADQLTKLMAIDCLKNAASYPVIQDVLHLTYVENRGAAFGSLTGQRWIFLVFSTVLIIALIIYTVKKRPTGILERLSIGMLIGGGIGNMIDRVALGYVIDFLDFCAFPSIWKWVFNGADAFVCIGTALLMILIIRSDPDKEKAAETGTISENTKGGTEDDMAE